MRRLPVIVAAAASAVALAFAAAPTGAGAAGASWQLEQPLPPPGAAGEEAKIPIGLGRIGDIEFWAPNRGLLITEGNPPTVPAGVWAYNGVGWHELATVCGATNGRIAWAGPEEFWTVSNGRRGQAVSDTNEAPPLEDNTLCHFVGGKVVASYAKPAFEANSYQTMAGAACFEPNDCWFGGAELPAPQIGAFQLHWNGQALNEEANPQGYPVESMQPFEGELYEGVRIKPQYQPRQPERENRLGEPESPTAPSDLHAINPEGISPTFLRLTSATVPIYTETTAPSWSLEAPLLGTDSSSLWAVADPLPYNEFPQESEAHGAQVTIVRFANGAWQQVAGAASGANPLTTYIAPAGHHQTGAEAEAEAANQRVAAIAPEPGGEDAWLGLGSLAEARSASPSARVARISPAGSLNAVQTLPSLQEREEGIGPKGRAEHLICPEAEDCWLVTSRGWLYHYASPATRTLQEDTSPAFASLITERPPDEGVPQAVPPTLPEDNSGLEEQHKGETHHKAVHRRRVPLISHVTSRLVHGSTLELRFFLAVKTRLRLVALRHHRIIAATPRHVLRRGRRHILLKLNPKRWPSKIELQTHRLGPIPTERVRERNPGKEEVTTTGAFGVLPRWLSAGEGGRL